MIITLDAFSGRPNPTLIPSIERENQILNKLVWSLVSSPLPADFPDYNYLGYRGFKIDFGTGIKFRVYKTFITNGTHVWHDSGLEEFLRDIFKKMSKNRWVDEVLG